MIIIQPLAKTGKVISSKKTFSPLNYIAKFNALSLRETAVVLIQ